MSTLLFEDLNLSKEIFKAIKDMGFENPSEIQYKAIPLIMQGSDIVGKSQTGTGKTVAFGVPSVEVIDSKIKKGIQVLILCPTRELAMQACAEIKKIAKFKEGVKTAEVYGGASIEKQITKLKTANIVVGTPGRIMDHMRRKTLKLQNVKMVVLDEADEMLSMGFIDDIEAILTAIEPEHQTVLFSATMPKEIMELTRKFQKSPKLVEVDKKKVTVSNIEQSYYNVPMGRKMDALNLLLRYYNPIRSMIFCNTKRMVDEITEYLTKHNFSVQGLHGDMKQSQRTKVMESFKSGKIKILVATDVAARGIDVNNIDYVINYDIPQNTEYYVHRIGRTGRAGKSGEAITICSGRRQTEIMKRLAKLVKSNILAKEMPSVDVIAKRRYDIELNKIKNSLCGNISDKYRNMVSDLKKEGVSLEDVVASLLQMQFGVHEISVAEVKSMHKENKGKGNSYKKIIINIGRESRVAPNHIVSAIAGSTKLKGKDIGKIEIFDDKTVVAVPSKTIDTTISQMKGCRICGIPTITKVYKGTNSFDKNLPSKDKRSKKSLGVKVRRQRNK